LSKRHASTCLGHANQIEERLVAVSIFTLRVVSEGKRAKALPRTALFSLLIKIYFMPIIIIVIHIQGKEKTKLNGNTKQKPKFQE
jgi:hypothetical protein